MVKNLIKPDLDITSKDDWVPCSWSARLQVGLLQCILLFPVLGAMRPCSYHLFSCCPGCAGVIPPAYGWRQETSLLYSSFIAAKLVMVRMGVDFDLGHWLQPRLSATKVLIAPDEVIGAIEQNSGTGKLVRVIPTIRGSLPPACAWLPGGGNKARRLELISGRTAVQPCWRRTAGGSFLHLPSAVMARKPSKHQKQRSGCL